MGIFINRKLWNYSKPSSAMFCCCFTVEIKICPALFLCVKKYSPESIYSCYRDVAPAQVSDSNGGNVAKDAVVGAVVDVIETVASADIACRRGRGL